MDLRQIEYFVRVAELGSFSKAALLLSTAQPALSRQVKMLETELGQALLRRHGRGVTLTDAGELFLKHGHGILHQVEQARHELRSSLGQEGGRIVVGLPPSLSRGLTGPLVAAFKQRFADAELAIVEGLSSHLAEWLQVGRIDLALLLNPDPRPEIDTAPVFEEALCLIGPGPRAADEGDTSVAFARLADYPLVIPDRVHAIRRLVETRAAHLGLKLKIAMEVASVDGMLDLVRLGIGFAVLPPSALAQRNAVDSYQARQIVEPRLPVLMTTAVSAVRPLTPLVVATRERVAEQVRQLAMQWGDQIVLRGV
ncbi:LysR family transcriptional regulator [Piscinibacter sakaiensis]|uniref:LysR family transcriptional regulator n=1 Tax=Piscinibacter sakaiensis TaxID=1547922 RepID=UPI003AAF15F6